MLKKFLQLLFPVILLTVTLQVMAQHTLPDKVCVGTHRNYKVTGLPNSVFTWKINGVVQPSTKENIDITWSEAGVYTIELQEHQINCSSDVKSGTVTVLPIPSAPVSTGDIIALAQNPIQTLNASSGIVSEAGTTIIWYEAAVGGTAVSSPTLSQVGTKTYYAEANNGICSSTLRTPVVLSILPEIVIPTVARLSTNDNTPAITGTVTVNTGDVFKVTVNGFTYTLGDGHLTLEGNTWSLQIPAGNELADGTYSVTATVTNILGNSSTDSTTNELVIDTSAPGVPTVNSLKTNDSTPVITGNATVNTGDVFKVTINGVIYTLGDGYLTLEGNTWSLQIPAGNELADGTYSVTATVTDSFGNSATDATANEIVIDTTLKILPTVNVLKTNDSTPFITGTAIVDTDETFKVTVNGITYLQGDGNLVLVGNNWSLQIPVANTLADGTYSVTATVTDSFGNALTDETNNELEIDATAPGIPTVDKKSTNDNTPLLTGTAIVNAGDVFKVSVNGITYTLGDGNLTLVGNAWSLQIPSENALADGTYPVTASITDSFGNTSTDITDNELIIDATAPEIPTVARMSTDDNTPLITGTATIGAGDVFKVSVNGVTYTLGDGHLTLNGNAWSLQIPAANKLDDGTYSVTATVTDSFGNSSEDQTKEELTIKTNNAPIARILGPHSIMVGWCSSGVQLDASASSGQALVYSWSPSNHLDNPSSPKPVFHPGSTTRYLLTVTDDKGRKDTASVRVVVADAPKAITDKNVFVETPETHIVLNGLQSTGVNLTYLWSTKEGHILAGEDQPAVSVNGLGTYYLQVKDAYGCTSRDSVSVGLYVQAVNDTAEIIVNQSVTINVLRNDLPKGTLNPSSISIVTPPSHGVASLSADSLIIYQPQTSYTGQDEFVYMICNYAGVCDNAKVLVLVNDLPLFMPEAFSPNGDGKNDRFVIKGLEKYKRVEIEIFNRWGNIVYQSYNYGEGEGKDGYWDGTASSGLRIESGPVPSGTYYYILKMNGQKNISGSLYLDR